MKADRLLSALLLLQAHGRLTGRDLARRLEVSERTIHRDMEALGAAGVPIFALRGARGGWQLTEGWQTKVPGLEAAELRALVMAQPPRVLGDLRLASAAERALGKVMASLPASLRQQAVSIRQRLHVDVEGWRGGSENLSKLPTVEEAVWGGRRLAIRYVKGGRERLQGEVVERIVDPLGLVLKNSAWYLVAMTPDGFRTYRISRMEAATPLDAPCVRPPDFDLATYWKTSTKEYEQALPRFETVLRVAPRSAAYFQRWRTASIVGPPGEPDAEGWRLLRVHFECLDEACFVVLGLGQAVEPVEPAALRDKVRSEAEALLARMAHLV